MFRKKCFISFLLYVANLKVMLNPPSNVGKKFPTCVVKGNEKNKLLVVLIILLIVVGGRY